MFSYMLQDEMAALEEFKASDKDVIDIVNKCKRFTREEWKKAIQPGDILIPYPKMKKVWLHYRLIGKLNQLIQGSSFTSCKIVGREAKEILGYGAILNTMGISKVGLETFLNDHEISLVLRHKAASKEKMEKVLDLMYAHMKEKTPYDVYNLVTSTLHHWVGTKDVKKEDEKFFNTAGRALICSTAIYKCYKDAGLNIQHPDTIGAAWLWPKDILLSSSMKVVGGYFSRDAKVPKPQQPEKKK